MAKEFINKEDISDALIERPVSFSIKTKHYRIYPATLGKVQLTARLMGVIGIVDTTSSGDAHLALLKAAELHREECIRLVAYSTLPGDDCLDESLVLARIDEFKGLDDVDIASALYVILTQDKTDLMMKQFGIDMENKRMDKVMKAKRVDKNTVYFGGRSIWGTLIDAACERYGWPYQYVLWGISYSSLKMLLSDQVRSVYLTDEERKRAGASADGVVIRADEAGELERFIKNANWR